jgi:hypothetical protein
MSRFPNIRPFIALLLVGGVLLPIAICIIFGVGALLSAMGDAAGGFVLNRICQALAILWTFDLISLVLFQSLNSITQDRDNRDGDQS